MKPILNLKGLDVVLKDVAIISPFYEKEDKDGSHNFSFNIRYKQDIYKPFAMSFETEYEAKECRNVFISALQDYLCDEQVNVAKEIAAMVKKDISVLDGFSL